MSATSSEVRMVCSPGGCLALHQRHQLVERTGHRADRAGGDLDVKRDGLQLAVPEQHLDDADVDVLLEQVSGEALAQRAG